MLQGEVLPHSHQEPENPLKTKRRAWTVATVVFFAGVVVAANRFKVPPVMQVLIDDLGVDMVTGGWLMSVAMIAGVLLAIPSALLLGRVGLRRTGLIAMGCTVLGSVVGALAPTAVTLMAGRIVEGVGNALIAVLAPTAISFWFESRDRGLPMGIWSSWVPVGNVIIFNLASPLLAGFGWRALWWLGGLCAAVAFVLVGFVLTEPPAPSRQPNVPPRIAGPALRSLGTWLLGLSFGAFAFSLIGYNTWVPTFLSDTLGLGTALASFYGSLVFLAGIPAAILAGWLAGLTGRRYSLLVAASLVTAVLLAWSFRLGSVAQVVPYLIALGVISNVIPALILTLVPETVGSRESTSLALSLALTLSYSGGVLGPPVLGSVISSRSWAGGGTVLVGVLAIGTVASWLAGRSVRRK